MLEVTITFLEEGGWGISHKYFQFLLTLLHSWYKHAVSHCLYEMFTHSHFCSKCMFIGQGVRWIVSAMILLVTEWSKGTVMLSYKLLWLPFLGLQKYSPNFTYIHTFPQYSLYDLLLQKLTYPLSGYYMFFILRCIQKFLNLPLGPTTVSSHYMPQYHCLLTFEAMLFSSRCSLLCIVSTICDFLTGKLKEQCICIILYNITI